MRLILEDVYAGTVESIVVDSMDRKPTNPELLRRAFVFITTEQEQCDLAVEDLRQIEGVDEVYRSLGCYDIVAKVSAKSVDLLRELVFQRIKNLSSIKSTLTLTIV